MSDAWEFDVDDDGMWQARTVGSPPTPYNRDPEPCPYCDGSGLAPSDGRTECGWCHKGKA